MTELLLLRFPTVQLELIRPTIDEFSPTTSSLQLIVPLCQIFPVIGGLAANKHVPVGQNLLLGDLLILENGQHHVRVVTSDVFTLITVFYSDKIR